MRIYRISKIKEKWEIQTRDLDQDNYDQAVTVEIEKGLTKDKLAKALSYAMDEKEGVKTPSKVNKWKNIKGGILVECDLGDSIGVMKCIRYT